VNAVSTKRKGKQMTRQVLSFLVGCALVVASSAGPSSVPAADLPAANTPATTHDIAGTYELVKRVTSDGKEVLPPAIRALYTMKSGRGNFNLFLTEKDGKLASESTISRYTLTADQYCEWIVFTTRNNLDKPGVSNEAPAVTNHCSPVTLKDGRIVFEPAGEGVVESFDKDGFTATVTGQFVDHWKKIR
jgi:hypothetical protein